MPRLDNSNKIAQVLYDLPYDPDDPGVTLQIDLCQRCASGWLGANFCEHPDYDDDSYECLDCGDELTQEDN